MHFTLQQLTYALAVAKEGSFQKAAEACHVTQPTLSIQIQKLESSLGLTLFDRSRHPVLPTEEAKEVLAQAQVVLVQAHKLQEQLNNRRTEVAGQFRLGLIPTLSPGLMPYLAPAMQQSYPLVELQVTDLYTRQILDALQREELDAAIIAEPPPVAWLSGVHLGTEPFVAYVGADAQLLKRVDLKKLDGLRLWLLGEGHCLGGQVQQLCRFQASDQTLRYLAGSLDTLVRMVDAQGGITVLPESYTTLMAASQRSNLRPLVNPEGRDLYLLFRRQALREKVRKAVEKLVLQWMM